MIKMTWNQVLLAINGLLMGILGTTAVNNTHTPITLQQQQQFMLSKDELKDLGKKSMHSLLRKVVSGVCDEVAIDLNKEESGWLYSPNDDVQQIIVDGMLSGLLEIMENTPDIYQLFLRHLQQWKKEKN